MRGTRRAKKRSRGEGHNLTSPVVWILPYPLNYQEERRQERGQEVLEGVR